MNTATKNKINVVCYSNLDSIYHFYDNVSDKKMTLNTPQLVIEKLYECMDRDQAKRVADLFPDFELLEPEQDTKKTSLEECTELLKEIDLEEKKKKQQKATKLFDPHLNKLKRMEYERSQRNTFYPDSVEEIVKKEANKNKSLLARFFSKK